MQLQLDILTVKDTMCEFAVEFVLGVIAWSWLMVVYVVRYFTHPYFGTVWRLSQVMARYGKNLTIAKSIQLMNACTEYDHNVLRLGCGVLGTTSIALFKDDKRVCTYSYCSCCPWLGGPQ